MTGAEIARLNEIIAKMKVSTVTQFTGIFGTEYGFPISKSDYEFIAPLMANASMEIEYRAGGIQFRTTHYAAMASRCIVWDCAYLCYFSDPNSFAYNAHMFYGLIGVLEFIASPICRNVKWADICTRKE